MRRLLAVAVVGAGLAGAAVVLRPRPPAPGPPAPAGPTVAWVWEARDPGGVVAAPAADGDVVCVTAYHPRGLRPFGRAYALDPATGKELWAFDAGGRMLPSASAPARATGRLVFGDGMHGHFDCRVYAVDAVTGAQAWAAPTADHVESAPAVAGGRVYHGAGNDGVYCRDAATGAAVWQFARDVHVDSSPWVGGGKVIVGTGPSRRYKALRVMCLDAGTGAEVWQRPVDLPAWGSPAVAAGRVVVGLGTGRLTADPEPPEVPAGGVACLDETTGDLLWTARAGAAVFGRPAVANGRVLFGSRDGHLYAVRADTGEPVFKLPMGGPVVAPPEVAGDAVYVVTTGGQLRCLDVTDGRERWAFDLKGRTNTDPLVVAGPRLVGGRVLLAAELQTRAGSLATVYCLQPPP